MLLTNVVLFGDKFDMLQSLQCNLSSSNCDPKLMKNYNEYFIAEIIIEIILNIGFLVLHFSCFDFSLS